MFHRLKQNAILAAFQVFLIAVGVIGGGLSFEVFRCTLLDGEGGFVTGSAVNS